MEGDKTRDGVSPEQEIHHIHPVTRIKKPTKVVFIRFFFFK